MKPQLDSLSQFRTLEDGGIFFRLQCKIRPNGSRICRRSHVPTTAGPKLKIIEEEMLKNWTFSDL